MSAPLVFCAIDTPHLERAKALVRQIAPITGAIKLGLEFFNTFGPQGVDTVMREAPDAALFLDLKFHDIPNTVARAVSSISKAFSPAYLNVHAAGGANMMVAAQNAVHDPGKTKLLAVTMLTSLSDECLQRVGYSGAAHENVVRMAKLTQDASLSGVVCSAHEIAAVRHVCSDAFDLVVPGIRPAHVDAGDQKRVMTPPNAVRAGATHLVIGRPITKAADPESAARKIVESLLV